MFLENRELVGYGNVAINSPLYPKNSFIKTLMNGDFGLVKTFLMYVILIGMFINIGFVMAPTVAIEILAMLILMVSTVFSIPLHIAMWRAANKYRGPKIWAILTKLNVKVHLFSSVWVVMIGVLFLNVDNYLNNV
ncbi:MAG: hypothetical protein L3J43_08025 [Sulfurovum sp.]|nr:hypothetical protein [Sulfurovum sp.]